MTARTHSDNESLAKPLTEPLPPTHQLRTIDEMAVRHPSILNKSRVKWSVRNRHRNGLTEARAVYETQHGRVLIHEPAYLVWFVRLSGRKKPRASPGIKGNKATVSSIRGSGRHE